jgi:ribosomal protein S18 acetylase RimI-like enzyme
MLYEASGHGDTSDPAISLYLEGWGRPGDAGVVALDPVDGRRIGAAWYRLMTPERPGYGFVDSSTPEIAIGVVADRRGRGVGGALLPAIMDVARAEGFDAVSLSVRQNNTAAVRLYERNGFVRVAEIGSEHPSWAMKAELSSGERPARSLKLKKLDGRMAVCRLDPSSGVPAWATGAAFFSITRTPHELSVVCSEGDVPDRMRSEGGWRVLALEGPFEFSEVGVLASVAAPLAEAGVSIFALSTYDTDYVLVKEEGVDHAVSALVERGHEVV